MVEGYEGRPGAGKTLNMVWRAWIAHQRGKPVYANIPLYDMREQKKRNFFFGKSYIGPVNEETYGKPWAGLVKTLDEVLDKDNALVLLDEVHMWLGATEWDAVDFSVRQYLAQQRKVGIDIYWTAQSNARVFNVVRELTAVLWSCQRYGPLSILEGRDPKSKENMGRKFFFVSPGAYQLYDTEFMVGSADGSSAGRYGRNRRYDRAKGRIITAEEEQPTRRVVRQEYGWCYARYGIEALGADARTGAGSTAGALASAPEVSGCDAVMGQREDSLAGSLFGEER